MKENAREHLFYFVIPTIQVSGLLKMDFYKQRNIKRLWTDYCDQLGIPTRNDINFQYPIKFGTYKIDKNCANFLSFYISNLVTSIREIRKFILITWM